MNISDIQNFFTAADRNHNGFISAKELKKSIKGQSTDVQQALSGFLNEKGKIDKTKFRMLAGDDNKISQEELLSLLTTKDEDNNITIVDNDELDTRLNTISNLSVLDKNNNGKITKKEILKAYKNSSTDSELHKILENFVTTTKKGKIKLNKATLRLLSDGKKYLTINDFFKADEDNDRSVTSEEVGNYFAQTQEFTNLDRNGNGKVTLKEIKKHAKSSQDSLFANYIYSLVSKKERKRVFKILSNNKKYISVEDIAKYDADKNGIICEEELAVIKNTAKGITN